MSGAAGAIAALAQRKRVAAAMPQHVRVDLHVKASRASRTFHHGREAAF
jgi:hypothetical protein